MLLSELQRRVRDAVILDSDVSRELWLAAGTGDAGWRLGIHRRHYETSLVTGLLRRFPATGWLLGSPVLIEAARAFIRRHPPLAPCMAEYGEAFPPFLVERRGLHERPYAGEFARLDWILGRVSVDVDAPAAPPSVLSSLGGEALAASAVTLQPGTEYLRAAWPIDELMRLYLTDSAPECLALAPGEVRLEIRGARGQFGFSRLTHADFAFRQDVRAGRPLGEAAEHAVDIDVTFDPGRALAALFAAGLVIAIGPGGVELPS
jgi:hypothetical protein